MIIIYDPPSFSIYEFRSRGENADMCDSRGMLNARSNEFFPLQNLEIKIYSHLIRLAGLFVFLFIHLNTLILLLLLGTASARDIVVSSCFELTRVFSLLPVTAGNEEPNRQFLGFCLLII